MLGGKIEFPISGFYLCPKSKPAPARRIIVVRLLLQSKKEGEMSLISSTPNSHSSTEHETVKDQPI